MRTVRRVQHGKPRVKARHKVKEKMPRKIKHLRKGKTLRLHVCLLFVLKRKLRLKRSSTGKCVLLERFEIFSVCCVLVNVGRPVPTIKHIPSAVLNPWLTLMVSQSPTRLIYWKVPQAR